MSYCSHCGEKIEEGQYVCLNCGFKASEEAAIGTKDESSMGYAVLGFFFPIVGLVLFLVWHDSLPLRAKSAGKGALASVIIGISLYIIAIIASAAYIW